MSKEDAPNFRELRHDRTCLNCKNGKVRDISYTAYLYDGNSLDCKLYNFTLCPDRQEFICDSWGDVDNE
jgi:hypothetical protein